MSKRGNKDTEEIETDFVAEESEVVSETDLISNEVIETDQPQGVPVVRQLALLGLLLAVILGSAATPKVIVFLQKNNITALVSPNVETTSATVAKVDTNISQPFSNTKVTAKAAYVWDINNQKVLYKKDESTPLPLASVTKLMTALLAQEVLDKSASVPVGELSLKQDGDSGLMQGEVFGRRSLSDLVLMSSSNDGAFALAAAVGNTLEPNTGANSFVAAMNIRAKELGLLQTQFKNPTGLDISPTEVGAVGSARDMAFLMEHIVINAPDILTYTRENDAQVYSKTGQRHDAENTNEYINKIPGLIGSKTGYTDLAGGNLVIAFNAGLNRPVVAVVLGSTQQERFTDIIKLVKETQAYVTQNPK
jgi:D-alanyl-D-alanine carboxypeptidase (penicillin-binding protein 5/6)